MDIKALDSRLDGVRYYDRLSRKNCGVAIATDIFNQCIKDTFLPWRGDEYIIKECCRSYANKMKIPVEEFVLIDCGGVSMIPVGGVVDGIMRVVGLFTDAVNDEVTIYRLYESGSLDTVWKGHVKNYGKTDDELIALLGRKGIISPVDEGGMRARENWFKFGGGRLPGGR